MIGRRDPFSIAEDDVRATASSIVEAVAELYGFRIAGAPGELGGTFKRNLFVRAAGPRAGEYVVHDHRPFITPTRVATVQRAVRALARSGLPVPRSIPSAAGEPLVRIEEHVVDVEAYVPSDGLADTWPKLLVATAPLARLHTVLAAAGPGDGPSEGPPVSNYGVPGELVGWVDETVTAVHAQQESEKRGTAAEGARALELCDLARSLLVQLDGWWRQDGHALPRCATHGDFGSSNVLFRGDEIAAIIDFDGLRERERAYDLARAFRYTLRVAERELFHDLAASGGEDPRATLDKLAVHLRAAADAYDASADVPLSGAERASLPIHMARIPLFDVAELGRYVSPHFAGPVHALVQRERPLAYAAFLVRSRDTLGEMLQ